MQQEIKKIIEQHLPEQTAGVMKEFVEEAEAIKAQLDDANLAIKEQNRVIADYKKKDADYELIRENYKNLGEHKEALDEREAAIKEREQSAEVTEARIRMEMMTSNMNNMHELVNKVFGHPSVSISRMVPIAEHPPVQDQHGNQQWGGVMQHPESETKTEGKE